VGGWSKPRPGRFTPGKDPVPIVQEAGCAPGPVWTCAKNLFLPRIRSPDRSQSLYRLSYRAHKGLRSIKLKISHVHTNLWFFPLQRPIRKIPSKGIIAVFEAHKYPVLTESGKHNYQCDVKLTAAINRHSPMMLAHKPCANCNGLGSRQQFPPPFRQQSNNTLPSTLPSNCGQTGAGLVETVAVGGAPCNELPGP
jgi:hypothetical protein